MARNLYLTTTLPYVNADPHLGFASEVVRADVLARYHHLLGDNVFFNTGTDEHGLKIFRQAQAAGQSPQEFANIRSAQFRDLRQVLGLSSDLNFIRTTDPKHIAAAQEFWRRCASVDDVYKKTYRVKYCVGCELEKTESELENSRCPIHPNLEIELIDEENYFFRFSKYRQKLLDLYKSRPDFVVPRSRLNEIKAFVDRGLEDFSISRLREKMPWGVPVPGDEQHVMYVWFDALVSYISTLGWPTDKKQFDDFWSDGTPIQFAGKDNIRQQAAMWQAMLMSAGLPPTCQIAIHGFITSGGQKMSKSLGNVLDPIKLVNEYGTDAVRYFLLRHVHDFEDSDVTEERIKEAYNADLANGLGNLVARTMKLAQDILKEPVDTEGAYNQVDESMNKFKFNQAIDHIWNKIGEIDGEIQKKKPWETKDESVIKNLVTNIYHIGCLLRPFMPNTADVIMESVKRNKKPETLFPREN